MDDSLGGAYPIFRKNDFRLILKQIFRNQILWSNMGKEIYDSKLF